MRFSRTCYDKAHRCPGWAGGGTKSVKGDGYRCDGGHIATRKRDRDYPGEFSHPGSAPWRFGHCTKCDVVTWPVVTRWLDPGWLRWKTDRLRWVARERWSDFRYHVLYRGMHPRRYASEQIMEAVLDD